MIVDVIHGSRISSISPPLGISDGLSTRSRAVVLHDLVLDARRGRQQIDLVFALQPLLHDLHVEQAEESAAETEAERVGRLRLDR